MCLTVCARLLVSSEEMLLLSLPWNWTGSTKEERPAPPEESWVVEEECLTALDEGLGWPYRLAPPVRGEVGVEEEEEGRTICRLLGEEGEQEEGDKAGGGANIGRDGTAELGVLGMEEERRIRPLLLPS